MYDPQAFIFLLRSNNEQIQSMVPWIFELKQTSWKGGANIQIQQACGPIFGRGYDIMIPPLCNQRHNEEYDYKEI